MSLTIQPVPLPTIWQVRQEVMYPDLSLTDMMLGDDAMGRHLGLYQNGHLRSIISLFQNGNSLQFRKFATLQAFQGQGFGKQLLHYVFEQAREEGMVTIWCNARTSAMELYRQFGMHPFGETWQQHGHLFVKMQVTL